MPKDVRGRVRLSKSVLEMKFMQRTKNRIRAERDKEESQAMYSKDISKGMLNAVDKFIIEPSYVPIYNLIEARVSYGGFNPEVEKFMTKPKTEAAPQDTGEMEKEVSDNEMADYSSSLGRTMANKFDKGRKRKLSKQFLKPED